jgi:hypothetical protein
VKMLSGMRSTKRAHGNVRRREHNGITTVYESRRGVGVIPYRG